MVAIQRTIKGPKTFLTSHIGEEKKRGLEGCVEFGKFLAKVIFVPGSIPYSMRQENKIARQKGNQPPNGLAEYIMLGGSVELAKIMPYAALVYSIYSILEKMQ